MSECGKLVTFSPRHRCGCPGQSATGGVEGRIHAFLAGETDGGELLHALYDHVLGEPIPAEMLALLPQ